MPLFTDSRGQIWSCKLTYDKAEHIKSRVLTSQGEPFDVFMIVEKGDFSPLKNIKTLVETAFFMVYEDVMRLFDLDSYNKENEFIYEVNAHLRAENREQKAFRWFSSAVDAKVLEELANVVPKTIVNFTMTQTRRDALATILEKEEEIETEAIVQGMERFLTYTEKAKRTIVDLIDKKAQNTFPQD